MKIDALASAMKIASMIPNSSSFRPLYKSVEFGPKSIRVCSEFGNLEICFEAGLDEPVLLDCEAVDVIVRRLPLYGEVFFEKQGGRVRWTTDSRSGYLHVVQQEHEIPKLSHSSYPWKPPDRFGDALVFASSSIQAASVSFGRYGVVIEPRGEILRLVSTNGISMSVVVVPAPGHVIQDRTTLRPPVPEILVGLLGLHPNLVMDVTEKGIFLEDCELRAHLPLSSPLETDLCGLADKYSGGNIRVEIDAAAAKEFLSVAKALTDKHSDSIVQIRAEAGNLILQHKSVASSTEEYLLARGLDSSTDYAPVSFPVTLFVVPLADVNTLILDYLPEKVLILHQDEPTLEFSYIIGGG